MSLRYRSFAQTARVPMGFALAFALLVFSRPTSLSLAAGGALAFAGLMLRLWAAGYIEKGKRMATAGPYAHTRNPLYLGTFGIGLGFAVAANSTWLVLLFLAFFLAVYWPVMRQEEAEMLEQFGDDYRDYSRRVPLFLPRLTSVKRESDLGFSLRRALENREYNSLLGFALAIAIIWLKMLLSR